MIAPVTRPNASCRIPSLVNFLELLTTAAPLIIVPNMAPGLLNAVPSAIPPTMSAAPPRIPPWPNRPTLPPPNNVNGLLYFPRPLLSVRALNH